jgi:hypothetical protein
MIPIAEEFYKTRQLPPNYVKRLNITDKVLPSQHLRACYSCLVNIVNGQMFGYWSENDAEFINGGIKKKNLMRSLKVMY